MSEPVRKRLEDMRSGDDVEGEDYVIITSENQAKYREYITKSVGDMVYLSPTEKNLSEIKALTGNNSLKVGDGVNLVLSNGLMVAEYHRIFPVKDTPKVGEKIYFNDFRSGAQKTWFDGQGNLKTALPDISKLELSEQRRFYTILRMAFRGINANPPKFADPDVPQPISKFFGDRNIFAFSEPELDSGVIKSINNLHSLLSGKDNELLQQILLRDQSSYRPIFDKDYKISDLFNDISNKKYKADSKTKEKLSQLFQTINTIAYPDYFKSKLSSKMLTGIKDELGGISGLANAVYKLDDKNEDINERQFKQFQDPLVYGEILKALYDPKAADRKSGFFKQIAENNGGEVTNPMATVIENVNYDKVVPKYTEQRNLREGINNWWDDWQDDHIKKFWDRALRHNYLESNTSGVVKAIAKCEINPQDGLEKILKKKADIKKVIDTKYSSSSKGFDFLCECLEDIQKSGNMDKAFAGALKNGKKASAIAKEIIKRAIAQGRVGDGKVALETLAVMRYDIFSSEHGKEVSKAIKGADFFKDASFMKNDAVKFVLNAAQKSFNLGVSGVFWTGVAIRNFIQHQRGKIPDSKIKELQDSMAKIAENSKKFKTPEEAEEAWVKAQDKIQAQLLVEKDLLDNSTTPPTKRKVKVSDLLDMRQRLYDLDDGQIEDKMEALGNRLAEVDRMQKRRDRAALLITSIKEKQRKHNEKEEEIEFLRAKHDARILIIEKLKIDKANFEKEIDDLRNIEDLKKQVSIAESNWKKAVPRTPEKKAAKEVYEKILSQKMAQELAYKSKYSYEPKKTRIKKIEWEINKNINPEITAFDAGEKNIENKLKELENFGGGKIPEDQQKFIFSDYRGDLDDEEAKTEHENKKMESLSPDLIFDYFGFEGLEKETMRTRNSLGARMSKKERSFYEANLELQNDLRNKHIKKLQEINENLADYDGYVMSERICHEEYKRLSESKGKGLEKDIPEKEYGGASSEEDQVEEMTWFWNACNGFEKGIDVNDYNPFVKHRNKSQTQAFKYLVAQKRAEKL